MVNENIIVKNIKDKWWLLILLVVLMLLFIIPSKAGLPGNKYKGCEVEGSQCITSTIKAITREPDNSSIITTSVNIEGSGSKDISFHLNSYNKSYSAGNKVFMNFSDKNVYIFMQEDSRLLWTLLSSIFDGSPASTATVDLTTMKEIDK